LPKDPKAVNDIKLNKRKKATLILLRIGLVSAVVGLVLVLISFSIDCIEHLFFVVLPLINLIALALKKVMKTSTTPLQPKS
jgi:hypothetical protein